MSLARVNSRRNCGEELGAVGRERRRNGKEEEEGRKKAREIDAFSSLVVDGRFVSFRYRDLISVK